MTKKRSSEILAR